MHGNTHSTSDGRKTRSFDAVLSEVETTIDVHSAEGTIFGGVHFELTGEDVTECVGGAEGLTEADLSANYATACDPRLNYRQALEMAIRMADRLARLA
jgi:3-deoxy-7-phosphoheptulonate synthase